MKFIAALFLLLVGSVSFAAPMNFDEVVKRYVALSPSIASAKAQLKSAESRLSEGRSSFFPEITLSGVASDSKNKLFIAGNPVSSEQSTYRTVLSASQPIYLGGRVYHEFKRRKEALVQARHQLDQSKNDSIARIIELVANWISLRDQILVLRGSQKTQKNFVEITRKKRRRGAVLVFDLDQVEAEFLSYEPRIEELRSNLIGIEQTLAVELGLDPTGEFNFTWPIGVAEIAQREVGPWFKKALEKRPDYLVAQSGVRLAERAKQIEMGSDRPSFALSAEMGYFSEARWSDHIDSDNEFHTYSASIEIPIFSGLSSIHKRRATHQLVVQADRQRRQLELSVEAEIRQALISLNAAKKRLQQTRVWSEKANRALRLGLKSYRVGRVTITQVVQLQGGRERAELGLISAKQALHLADLKWQAAIGTNLEEYYTSGQSR